MAVTSAMSSELIAVVSLCQYDIYKAYRRPGAESAELIPVGYRAVIVFAVIMAAFSTGLHYTGVSMGYLYLLMGVLISSVGLPITLALVWKRMNWYAAEFSSILGLVASVTPRLVAAKHQFGKINVASTGANNPMLVG